MSDEPNPNFKEITDRLEDIQKTIDELCENTDTRLMEIQKLIETSIKAALDAPNRTGTVLETNQQTIYEGIKLVKKSIDGLSGNTDGET